MLLEWPFPPELLLVFIGLGMLAGILAGMLGLGGGVVIVPALLFIFAALGFDEEVRAQMAVATSLATICFTSVSAIYTHHRKGAVQWSIVRCMVPGVAAGALAGAWIADRMPGLLLEGLFGLFAMLVAVQMFATRGLVASAEAGSGCRLGRSGLFVAGGMIGTISSLFGIGGGSLTVPFMSWCRLQMQHAVAVSSACGLPIALAGVCGFIWMGWDENVPAGSLGYLYVPAALAIVVSSIPFAVLAARWAHKVPSLTLKKVFAAVLFCIGLRLLFGLL